MELLTNPASPQRIAQEMLIRLRVVRDDIIEDTVDIPDNYDGATVALELIILAYTAFRLGIQTSGASRETIYDILSHFDPDSLDLLQLPEGIEPLLNHRGQQYLKLFNFHRQEIIRNDSEQYPLALALKFDQFCHNAGEDNDPVVISGAFSMLPIGVLANKYWSMCFFTTFSYIKELNIK